jgi:hypothetical protein
MLSQREAAAQWGMGRATLQRAIRAGKVSAGEGGRIEVSEMIRAFGEPGSGRPATPHEATPRATDEAIENARLKAENEGLRAELAAVRENLTDLRGEILRLTGPKADAQAPTKADPTGRRVLIGLAVFTALVIAAVVFDLPSAVFR